MRPRDCSASSREPPQALEQPWHSLSFSGWCTDGHTTGLWRCGCSRVGSGGRLSRLEGNRVSLDGASCRLFSLSPGKCLPTWPVATAKSSRQLQKAFCPSHAPVPALLGGGGKQSRKRFDMVHRSGHCVCRKGEQRGKPWTESLAFFSLSDKCESFLVTQLQDKGLSISEPSPWRTV